MSAYGMKPLFKDQNGYRRWKAQWRLLYKGLATDIQHAKRRVKASQRSGTPEGQKQLGYQRVMASKAMSLLNEAKQRWARLLSMRQQIAEQMARFPLIIKDCRTVDFHYNRGANEFPDLPKWVLKTKGQTLYVHHIDAACAWSTRETDGSTKGMLRFRNCHVEINKNGEAVIRNNTVDGTDLHPVDNGDVRVA